MAANAQYLMTGKLSGQLSPCFLRPPAAMCIAPQRQEVCVQYSTRRFSAGTTLTVAVLMDWLLTVACVGDSKAALDVGTAVLELTPEHRVQTHEGERARLKVRPSACGRPLSHPSGVPAACPASAPPLM